MFQVGRHWSLIVKHNRRKTRPDPDLEAMAPLLPSLLARAAELLTNDVPDNLSAKGGY